MEANEFTTKFWALLRILTFGADMLLIKYLFKNKLFPNCVPHKIDFYWKSGNGMRF